jgi:ATP-dependent Lon protease
VAIRPGSARPSGRHLLEANDISSDPNDAAFVSLLRGRSSSAARAGAPRLRGRQEVSGDHRSAVADFVAAYVETATAERQSLLETLDVEERVRRVLVLVQRQLSVLEAQEEIRSKVREELGGRQREAYLREQMKAIQKELGETDEAGEADELKAKLDALVLPRRQRVDLERPSRIAPGHGGAVITPT